MRKIALLMDGWGSFITTAWSIGIINRIKETNEDVNLYVFNSTGNWSNDVNYNLAEYNIFRLPDLKSFDAIILELTNVTEKRVLEETVKRVKEANVPVLSISEVLADFKYVGVDNFSASVTNIKHLYNDHNCRSFYFIMGPKDNYENKERVRGIAEFMRANDLDFSEENLCYDSFAFESGYDNFKRLYNVNNNLPDAVVCVNDDVAMGVCEAAKELGLNVPRDFLVTGFDNFDKAKFYMPKLTTTQVIRENIGYKCMDLLCDYWHKNIEIPDKNYIDYTFLTRESCGCPKHSEDISVAAMEQMIYSMENDKFSKDIMAMSARMGKCNNINDIIKCIKRVLPLLKCDAMCIAIDPKIYRYNSKVDTHTITTSVDFKVKGYPNLLNVPFFYDKDADKAYDITSIRGIFPTFEADVSGQCMLFLPIHFGKLTVGFIAVRGALFMMLKQYTFTFVNAIQTALEAEFYREKIDYMNHKLKQQSIMDFMTGIYNRLGYSEAGNEYFNKAMEMGRKVLIMYLDLDRLKYINDNFGHENGDIAITLISDAMREYSDVSSVMVRMGGDEFILLQECTDESEVNRLEMNIRNYLKEKSAVKGLPFVIDVSIGSVIADPVEEKLLSEYEREAEIKMYNEKSSKKVMR